MKLDELLKKLVYGILFGFVGILLGIWIADILYVLGLKSMERVETIYVSMFFIIIFTGAASYLGFAKGTKLLES